MQSKVDHHIRWINRFLDVLPPDTKLRLEIARFDMARMKNPEVTVTNTGKCEGEEVVQLYVRDEVASITRPIKELKGFEKIKLSPGESKMVTFDVKDEQLGFYNNQMKFIVEKGDFTLMVGGNSRDLQEIKYILN